MTNPGKSAIGNWQSAIFPLLLFLLFTSCRTADNRPDGPIEVKPGYISIRGVVSKSFAPEEVNAVKLGERVSINLVENFPCGVTIQFARDLKPGTYPINDHMRNVVVDVAGEYSPDCGKTGTYLSTDGSLKLTDSGDKYSGTFDFSAALAREPTKTIRVSGNFTDISPP